MSEFYNSCCTSAYFFNEDQEGHPHSVFSTSGVWITLSVLNSLTFNNLLLTAVRIQIFTKSRLSDTKLHTSRNSDSTSEACQQQDNRILIKKTFGQTSCPSKGLLSFRFPFSLFKFWLHFSWPTKNLQVSSTPCMYYHDLGQIKSGALLKGQSTPWKSLSFHVKLTFLSFLLFLSLFLSCFLSFGQCAGPRLQVENDYINWLKLTKVIYFVL